MHHGPGYLDQKQRTVQKKPNNIIPHFPILICDLSFPQSEQIIPLHIILD